MGIMTFDDDKPHFEERGPRDQPPLRKEPFRPVKISLLYLGANACYLFSLQAASTPTEMNDKQGMLGIALLASVCLVSAQFWSCARTRYHPRNVMLQSATTFMWYLYDNGNRLHSHGAYNMLVFFMLLIPLNLTVAMFRCWWWLARGSEKPRRFVLQFLAMFLILNFALLWMIREKETALEYGFFGKSDGSGDRSLVNNGTAQTCRWNSAVPWLDFIPFRLNFWLGPMICPSDDSFTAKLVDDVLWITGCERGTDVLSYFDGTVVLSHPGAAYALLPRTETWGLPLKHDSLDSEQNALQVNVLKYLEENTFPYLGPTAIPNGTDAMLAWCGSAKPKIVRKIGASATLLGRPNSQPTRGKSMKEGLNVVTIFVDSVSRNHFHRMMPKTRRTIEHLGATHDTGVYELFHYHTVGFNTGPNTRAMWAGLDEREPGTSGVPIWEQFERAGYVGGRIDPMCQDWDAYYGTAHLEQVANATISAPRISHEYISWSCLPPYLKLGKNSNGNFDGAYALTARCISDTHVGWHTLEYAADFIAHYTPRSPFYLHATFMEAHEGSGAVLGTLDEALAAFLDPAQGSPIDYRNTAIVIAADHGALMGLRSVAFENGRVEAASPLGVFILPGEWTRRADRAVRLEKASHALVTGFDLYETIRGFGGDALIGNRPQHRRGVDLAHEHVAFRTCEEAGISEVACKCN